MENTAGQGAKVYKVKVYEITSSSHNLVFVTCWMKHFPAFAAGLASIAMHEAFRAKRQLLEARPLGSKEEMGPTNNEQK